MLFGQTCYLLPLLVGLKFNRTVPGEKIVWATIKSSHLDFLITIPYA